MWLGSLNRGRWSALAASRVLLTLLVAAFAPTGPVVIGLDDTIERRWGAKIKARGIYRDPVRSSHGHFVKTSGLRWLAAMLLVPIPWTGRIWALPFLTVLCPSERYAAGRRVRHKKLTDWARQMIVQVARWLPERRIVLVADHSFAALDFLDAARRRVCVISRLRLDARLFAPAAPRSPHTIGRPRRTGARLPTLNAHLTHPQTPWRRITVPGWYGEEERLVEIAPGEALWSHPGLPVAPLRWVLIRDETEAFDLDHMEGMQIAETREDLAHQAGDGDSAGSGVADKDEMQAQAFAGHEPMPTLFGVGGEASMSRAISNVDRTKPDETVDLGQELVKWPRRSIAPPAAEASGRPEGLWVAGSPPWPPAARQRRL